MSSTTKQNYFLSQPHQPFFLLGVINALIMMLLFALSYKGVLTIHTEILNFHVYSLIFTVLLNVFTGFLFTTFPRFCQTELIDKVYYTKVFYTNILGSIAFLAGAFSEQYVMIVGMATLFISHSFIVLKLQSIYNKGQAGLKEDPFWILAAQYFGLVSHLLFIGAAFGLNVLPIAVNLSFYMFVIFLTFSVAQRMIPFFSHSREPKSQKFINVVFILLIFKTTLSIFDFKLAQIVLDLALGGYLLKEFVKWKLPIFSSPSILWVLHLGLFWLPTALFFSALTLALELFLDTSFFFLSIHMLAIGFVITILIGFGTRVTLGHSGQTPNADKIATNIFWFIQAVVILRALYSVNLALGWNMGFLFDISFTAWLVLFLAWGIRYGRVLVFGTKI